MRFVVRKDGVLSALGVVVAVGVLGCGGSASRSSSTAATTASRSVTTSAHSAIAEIRALCTQAKQRVAAIPQPSCQDPTSPSAISYETRVVAILDQLLGQAIASSSQVPSRLHSALIVEARGQKLVDAQIPALAHHDVSKANRLAAEAGRLTAPADASIRQAGLAICVGS